MATESTRNLTEDDFTEVEDNTEFDDDEEEVEWILDEPGTVIGEVVEIKENCGENNNRVYKLVTGIGEPKKLFWGASDIDRKMDKADVGPTDLVRVERTDETRDFTVEVDGEEEERSVTIWKLGVK